MMRCRYLRPMSMTALLSGLVAVVFTTSTLADKPRTCDTGGQQRPAIGLALSGGGARGAAHIGVIKVLEELRIPIDCIAGTSMGSIIGGLYASGMSTDDLERAINEIDWAGVFQDEADRAERTFRRKSDDLLFLVKKKARVKDGKVNIGEALIQGQKFDLVLSELTLPVHGVHDFDKLRIPFRAVATDITNGHEVILGEGSLARALRASMAVPAAFAAVELDDHLLVDGGIVNNLPISVVRDMGADVIIAVDISTPLRTRDELASGLDVLDQLSGLLTRRNVQRQLATLTERDVLLIPPLGEVGSADFDRIQEAVPTGEVAARKQLASLKRYAVPAAMFDSYLALHQAPDRVSERPVVDFVRIDNDSRVSDAAVAGHLDYQPGALLDTTALDAAIGRVYGMDIFESVRYRLVEEDGKTGVVIDAREKSWGTDSVQLGIELSSDLEGDSFFNIGGAYTKQPFNDLNGEWRTIGYLGEEPSLVTEIYQPLDPAERWFASAGVGMESSNVKAFVDREAVAEYDLDQVGVVLAGGYNVANRGRLEARWRRFEGHADVGVGTGLQDFDYSIGELRVGGAYDTLDSIYFPREGLFGSAIWVASRESLGADDDFDQYLFNVSGAKSWGGHTLLSSIRFETTDDNDAPIQSRFRTGGFLRLSGLQQNELSGQHVASVYLGYMYRMTDRLVPTYVGASFETGNVWEESSDIMDDNLLAGSVFVGADTVLGPLYVAYGHAEGGDDALYLFLGQPWFGR